MDTKRFDNLAVALGTHRRAVLGGLAAAALAGLAPASGVVAACRAPKKPCARKTQCCTGKCKRGKCAKCPNGAKFVPAPDLLCWLEWGSAGGGDAEFDAPTALAARANGHVYVADRDYFRIQEFDAIGRFVHKWGEVDIDGNPVFGEFDHPSGVAVGGNNHVYVADTNFHRVQEFDLDSATFPIPVGVWGSLGAGDAQFNGPSGLAMAQNGAVYVADTGNHRIVRMQPLS